MTTTTADLAPELRLALLAACDAAAPQERAAERTRRWTSRLTVGLASTAAAVTAYDVLLLAAA